MRLKQISDGSHWNGIKEASDLDWKLRYAPDSITRGDILAAASIIESYVYMIAETTQKKRDLVCMDVGALLMKREPPKPPLMRVGCNGLPCPLCGSGMKPSWFFFKSKGCYQPECENYWRSK